MDVQPQNQNIDKLFSNTTFYIDFYQRQYKWSDEPVKRLLDDIFYKFNEEYKKYKELSLPLDQVVSKYGWYYLNTYVTNNVDGKLYIVDGKLKILKDGGKVPENQPCRQCCSGYHNTPGR